MTTNNIPEFICHRINTIKELEKIDTHYGVEIDIRDDPNTENIHIAHDPFILGENLEKYLSHYKHGTLILNVKSERVELKAIELLKKYEITNYFFLDSSFPMMVLLNKKLDNKNIACRFSEYEIIEQYRHIKTMVNTVWVDCFTILPLTKSIQEEVNNDGNKTCIVSPELQGKPEDIEKYKLQLKENNIFPDMICCKRYNIELWL
jgi:hypothetical protein